MTRANAISLLNNYSDPIKDQIISTSIIDKDPLIRYAAISLAQFSENPSMLNLIINSLNDSVKLVRIMAANALSRFNLDNIPSSKQKLYEERLNEYTASLMINADHPGTHVNFGNLHLNTGDLVKAEASYKEAIEIEPGLVTAYINLADLYRRTNQDEKGERILFAALEKYPDLAAINYSLGLLKIRMGEQDAAISFIKKAAELAPEQAHYSYVYAIGLNSLNQAESAIEILESALKIHPYNRDILYAITTISLEREDLVKAKQYARMLVSYYPTDENYKQVLEYLDTLEP
jgi:tetratricopeptide (TPR) repeat protein